MIVADLTNPLEFPLAQPPSYYQKLYRERQAGNLSQLPLCPNCQRRRIIPRAGKEPKKLLLGDSKVPVCYTCWRESPHGTEYLTQKKQESRERKKQTLVKTGQGAVEENVEGTVKETPIISNIPSTATPKKRRSQLVVLSSPPPSAPNPILTKYLAPRCLESLKNLQTELSHKANSPGEEGTTWKQTTLDRLQGQLEITLPLLRCPISFSDICKLLESSGSEHEPHSVKFKRVQFEEFTNGIKKR